MEGLLREVSRRIASERAEPRKDKLVELDAEAHWPKKGSREVLRRKSWTHPMKGDLRLRSARRRLLTMPEGSPPEASRLMAVPEGRQWRKKDRREKAKEPVLTDLDRSMAILGVSGKRWLRA